MNLFKYFVCAYYTICLILSVYSKENLIWYKIPQFYVTESVNNFLNQHKINNCFYKFENDDTLLLKCWRNNQLVDVSIIIKKHKNKKFHYSLSI